MCRMRSRTGQFVRLALLRRGRGRWLLPVLLLIVGGLWLATPQTVHAQTIITVDADAPGPVRDGLSWTTAYTSVQDALDLTNANGGVTYEIWVAEGVYYPDEGGGHVDNAVSESFRIAWDNVQLYGGFAATETLRTQRDWLAHPTILSGDIDQNDANADGNFIAETWADLQGSNAYHVLWLDGVTNQSLTAATVLDGFTVTGGNASSSSPPNYLGGGLYCAGNAGGRACSPTLRNLMFSGNQAYGQLGFYGLGGGMYNNGSNYGASSPTLTNVTFSGNRAAASVSRGYGGGMYNNGSLGESSPMLIDVIFQGNAAASDGGGMYNNGEYGMSSPALTNVIFQGNTAELGGGMVNLGDFGASSPTLTNVTFSGNAATSGGGVYSTARYGVGYPTLENCVLWGNTASSGAQIYNALGAAPVVRYSIVQGGYTGAGNLDADPRFVAPVAASSAPTAAGNYRLQTGSPAIDAGNNLSVTVATDLDGKPRIVNGVVDMGAYEAAPMLRLAKQVTPTANVPYQGVVTYTLTLSNTGTLTETAAILTDTLPGQVVFGAWVENAGAVQAGNAITWTGAITPTTALTFTFTATHTQNAGIPITNTAFFSGAVQAGWAAADFTALCRAAITVQNPADDGAGSLRQAIDELCPGGTIDFAPGMRGALIPLDSQLAISKSLTITGSVPVTVSGGGSVRIFSVSAGVEATLAGLTLYNGFGADDGYGYAARFGGAIRNAGVLTVTHSVVYSSSAPSGGGLSNDGGVLHVVESTIYSSSSDSGGAIFQLTGALLIENSTLAGNTASYGGGAMYVVGGAATMTASTVSGNTASQRGGGVYHGGGVLVVAGSTFSGNQAQVYGGGIASGAILTVTNSTFAANRAFFGGGIGGMYGGSLTAVTNGTFSDNRLHSSGSGADIYNEGTLHLANSVLANAAAGANCVLATLYGGGVITTNLNNLVEDGTCSAGGVNFRSGDPLLGALGNYGGRTPTFPLLLDSPAIDAGDAAICAAAPVGGVDQRGVTRPQGFGCDRGAFEAPATPKLSLAKQVTPTPDVAYQGVVTYTLILSNTGNLTDTAILTDTLPGQVDFGAWVENPGATVTVDAIAWTGTVSTSTALTFTFTATHTHGVDAPITNTAFFSGSVQAGSAAAEFIALCSAAITVQNGGDSGAGSLRQAIADVCSGGVIDFAPGLNGATIPLGSQLAIAKSLTITGSVPITLSGGGSVRLFTVNAGAQATLAGLTLYNGDGDNGGAIYNAGALTLTHSHVYSSSALYSGGAIYLADGALVVEQSTLTGNTADNGGALHLARGAAFITGSTIAGNTAANWGGGIASLGAGAPRLVVASSTLSGNQAGVGGAIFNNSGVVTVTNSTIAANTALGGGGIYNRLAVSQLGVTNSTFAGNRATFGGADLYNDHGVLRLANSVLANAAAGANCETTIPFVTNANNLVEDGTCSAGGVNFMRGDPVLGVLGDYGGAAQTLPLLPGSPAIDAGDATICAAAPVAGVDQRGVVRPQGAACDIGAFESRGFSVTASGGSEQRAAIGAAFAQPLTLTVASATAEPVVGGQIVFTAPVSGASLAPVTITATVDATGSVSAAVTANQAVGGYSVGGAAHGVTGRAVYTLTNDPGPTTTALTSAPNASAFGQSVTFTATVTVNPPGAGTPNGVITFTTGASEYATALSANGVATVTTASLPVGSHVVTATYGGDGSFVTSSDSLTQTVGQAGTTTTLTSAPNASAFGQSVTFTATVTVNAPGAGTPSGVITFTTGASEYATALSANGVATVTTASLPVGSHVVTATYGGDGSFVGSLITITYVVARSAVAVAFTPAPNPATYGQAVSVAVTVTALHILPAGELSVQRPLGPGGVVTLYDGVDAVTAAVVVNGVATASWPLPATGAHTLTVVYGGDDRHAPGAAADVALLVAQAATTSTLAAPPAATIYGAPATFTVTVQPTLQQATGAAPPALTKPTGQVQLQAGDVVLGVGALVEGVAVIDVSVLAGGVHTLTAAYAGDANYLASTAAAIQHTVLPAPAQTNLVAAPNPAAIHTPVTFTATVQAAAFIPDGLTMQVGLATPTGQVTFQAGATVLGSGVLANGVATVTTDALAWGDHAITAQYGGDANYQAALSAALTQTITAPTPLAVNDAAGVLEGAAVTIPVLANDHDPAGGGLTVIAVSQPAHGATSIDPGNVTVRYAANPGVGGVDSFTYTLQDIHGQQSTATVAVVVTVLTETDAPPQVAVLDPAVQSTAHFTSSQATVTVDAPAGVYTGTLAPAQLFFLSYTPIVTPTTHTLTPPGTLQFGNFEFDLTAYLDDQPLHGLVFAQPLVLTIRYDPALLSSLQPATLGLFFWDGTGWSTDGIVILSHDLATATLTLVIAHPGEFAFFAAAVPTVLEPAPEPNVTLDLYLPAVMR
jgi:uncharacterized repeat protein (TIGR01451 family)